MTSEKVKKSIEHALEQLHEEKERIENAIDKLESFLGNLLEAADGRTRKGRGAAAKANQRSRAGWTDEARDAARARMRKYWAERRKNSSNGGGARRDKRASEARSARGAGKGRKAAAVAAMESRSGANSKKGWSPEAREAARERMRTYWEQRRKSASSG